MAIDRRWRWIGWLILGIGTSIVAGGLALGWGSLRHVLYAERAEGSSAGTENKLEAFHSKTLPGFTVRLASLPATRVESFLLRIPPRSVGRTRYFQELRRQALLAKARDVWLRPI